LIGKSPIDHRERLLSHTPLARETGELRSLTPAELGRTDSFFPQRAIGALVRSGAWRSA
jgi:hypothetical protein